MEFGILAGVALNELVPERGARSAVDTPYIKTVINALKTLPLPPTSNPAGYTDPRPRDIRADTARIFPIVPLRYPRKIFFKIAQQYNNKT